MLIKALSTAATGMKALQFQIDTIANNLANVNTTGFKNQRAEFQDLIYQGLHPAGSSAAQSGSQQIPTGIEIGSGVKLSGTTRIFSEGPLENTSNPLDLAIEGEGFFRVLLPDGSTVAYTRDGSFKRNRDGNLVTSGGLFLNPQVSIPNNIPTNNVSIDVQGFVQGIDPAAPQTPVDIGQVTLVRFPNPSGLRALGDNLYLATQASGDPVEATPGTQGLGDVRQNFLEGSNVQVVKELVDMITAQRAFEVNSKSIQAADQMLQTVNTLGR